MIYVVNKRTHATTDRDVYVGRSGLYPSPLANQWTAEPFGGTRAEYRVGTVEEALRYYDTWLTGAILSGNKEVCAELDRIAELARSGDVYLVCHCVNARNKKLCHAFSIKAAVEGMLGVVEAEATK